MATSSRGSRRRSRIVAFQTLFESDVTERPPGSVLARYLQEAHLSPDAERFARGLVSGVANNRVEIDGVIERYAPAYPLTDMAPVDRNVLRLAIYEVLFDNRRAPLRVAINEAVEIAKGYGSESSGRFVNGVLGAVAMEAVRREEAGTNGHAEGPEAGPDDRPADDDDRSQGGAAAEQ
jgi:N utilization substance protein B